MSWNAVSGATSYNVKRSTTSGGPYTTVASVPAPGTQHPDNNLVNATTYYYVVSAVNGTGESANSAQVTAAPNYILLSELKANPPGSVGDNPSRPESLWEYLELTGTPGYNLANHYLVVINGTGESGMSVGRTTLVVPLTGNVVPANGNILIKQAGHPTPPVTVAIPVLAAHRIPAGAQNVNDELIPNASSTVLLVFGPNAPQVNVNYHSSGTNNNGVLNATWTGLGLTIVDSVAWRNSTSTYYTGAPRIRQKDGQPDALTRIPAETTPINVNSWWCGSILGAVSALSYSEDLDQQSGSETTGVRLSPNCFLTPGAPNEPSVPNGGAGAVINFIRPFAQFISPNTPFTGDIALPTQGAPALTSVGVSFNNSPTVFDDLPNHLTTYQSGGVWYLRLKPGRIADNRILTLLPNNDWSRARTIAFSTLQPHPNTVYSSGGNLFPDTTYAIGISDASTAIPMTPPAPFLPFALIADDETNLLGAFNYFDSAPAAATYIPNIGQLLGVSLINNNVPREVDFEGSTLIGNTAYWIGGMANGPEDPNPAQTFPARPDRNRLFAATVAWNGVNNYNITYQGDSRLIRSTLINHANYTAYRLVESAAAGVDSKQPWGFNIEGLEASPDNSSLYLGFRAPLVPAPAGGPINGPGRGNLALIARLNNYTQITASPNNQTAPTFGTAITLNLSGPFGGRGIRAMNRVGGTYYIVAGPPTTSLGQPGDFAVFTWDGDPAHNPVEWTADLAGHNVEGISLYSSFGTPNVPALTLVEDNGAGDWYGDGGNNKDHPFSLWGNLRRSRSFAARLGVAAANPSYLLDTPNGYYTGYIATGLALHREPDPVFGTLMGGSLVSTSLWSYGWLGPRGMFRSVGPGSDTFTTIFASGPPSEAVLGLAGDTAIGYGGSTYNGYWHYALQWSIPSGNVVKMLVQTPTGNPFSEARGITPTKGYPGFPLNDYVAVGLFEKPTGFGAFYRILSDSSHAELSGLQGATINIANGINEYLTIVGSSGSTTQTNACIWKPVYGVFQLTKLPQIAGAGAGESSEALGINRNGTIVGYAYRGGVKRPCLWAFVESGYRAYELASLANAHGQANDISDRGEVVGTCLDGLGGPRACLWANGRLHDLNTRIGAFGNEVSTAPNVTLWTATRINNSGWISGSLHGSYPGPESAIYIMTPQ